MVSQGAANLAFRGTDDDEQKEKIEMVEKFRSGSKSVSFSESEEPKRRTRLNPILSRQKKSLEDDPVNHAGLAQLLRQRTLTLE